MDAEKKASNGNTSVFIYRNMFSAIVATYSSILQQQLGGESIMVVLSPNSSTYGAMNNDIFENIELVDFLDYNDYVGIESDTFTIFDGDIFLE